MVLIRVLVLVHGVWVAVLYARILLGVIHATQKQLALYAIIMVQKVHHATTQEMTKANGLKKSYF